MKTVFALEVRQFDLFTSIADTVSFAEIKFKKAINWNSFETTYSLVKKLN